MNELAMIDQNIVWFFFNLISIDSIMQTQTNRERESEKEQDTSHTRSRSLKIMWLIHGACVLLSLPHWLAIRVHIIFIHLYFFFFFLNFIPRARKVYKHFEFLVINGARRVRFGTHVQCTL